MKHGIAQTFHFHTNEGQNYFKKNAQTVYTRMLLVFYCKFFGDGLAWVLMNTFF
jgi:hypothetical protein